ncbi:terminase small subunit [Companilactobacillus hulinensis]|uniref:terminase small subunit n=1 Tax=Companilactobacillus hulinensis TaxID=2486007 RepID=UPI000F78BB1C|nr:terminase small subunit [Companilactobacillus hulinensis]
MDKWKEAEKDYLLGMKYKDIASKYEVSINTVKSWKSRHGWQRGTPNNKNMHTKPKKGAHKEKKVAPEIIDELEANGELNEKQKLFCLFYLQRFNATWAYQQAYGASYANALSAGPRLLGNVGIKKQLAELKKKQSTDLYFDINDVVREFLQQSKSDIRDVVDFKTVKRFKWYKIRDKNGQYVDSSGNFRWEPKIDPDTGQQEYYYENIVNLHDSDEIDTSSVKSIRIDKGEAVVEMYDKQKALDSLMKYADIFTSKNDNSDGVQILDNIEGDDDDDDTD